ATVGANRGATDGPRADARFNAPFGVAFDVAGNLYVADRDNETIRKITPAGIVSTLAGAPLQEGSADGPGPLARFNHPTAIAVDGNGRIYVADTDNHLLRKIDAGGN